MIFTKIAVACFALGSLLVVIAGNILCLDLIQKLNSTLRFIIYIGISIISIITLCMNLSYMGIPYVVLYGMIFATVGFCSLPIRVIIGDYK